MMDYVLANRGAKNQPNQNLSAKVLSSENLSKLFNFIIIKL